MTFLEKFFKKPGDTVQTAVPGQSAAIPAPVRPVQQAQRAQISPGVPGNSLAPVHAQGRGIYKTRDTAVVAGDRNAISAATAGSASRSKAREATAEEVEKLTSPGWKIITGTNGIVEITETQSKYVVLLASERDGKTTHTLVVARDYARNSETSSVKIALQRKGYSWVNEFHVDLPVIGTIYERTGGNVKVKTGDVAQMQKAFIDLVAHAAKRRCSDIHLDFENHQGKIRVRADNVIMKLTDLLPTEASAMCQAAFAMAEASDSTYNPQQHQGARITEMSVKKKGLALPSDVSSLRLQFNTLSQGRYLVVRLLYAQKVGSNEDVDTLGYAPNQMRDIKIIRRRKEGVIIISGPTGAGKSTTLQRSLSATAREYPGLNILTIEDPPEYFIPGAIQIAVVNATTAEERNEKFRQAITAALRSDPNIIMIGEIRDTASAMLAFEAAMTGHLTWASLHANNAISNLDRLRDKKVEIYKLCDASLIAGLIAQRLVRRTVMDKALTFEQAVEAGLVSKELEEYLPKLAGPYLSKVRFAGEKKFNADTGEWELLADVNEAYKGRTVCAEVIRPDQTFLDFYKDDKKSEALKYWIDKLNGMTMREHGLMKIMTGEVCPNEIDTELGSLLEIPVERVSILMSYVA
jgi:type II secretory ATPase GspE/PulE/Tfp pilus assembly ATPase PilB-like protein